MTNNYLFFIYSCKKNINNANNIYEKINNNINNTKVYIIYGDKLDKDYILIDDKYIVLNVDDDYDHLCDKTLALIKMVNSLFKNIDGIFKCDDDVIINLNDINSKLSYIRQKNIDYCGNKIIRTKQYNDYAKKNNIDKYDTYECIYCGGPLYYLSKKSLDTFNNDTKRIYYEDMMVGYHLNKYNIIPIDNFNLYSDYINDSITLSYHNKKHLNNIQIIIQGGIGNQLFQLACVMKLAEKYNKQFSLNIKLIVPNPHQSYNIQTSLKKILSLFPNIKLINDIIHKGDYYEYIEDNNECFIYNENKLDNYFSIYNNILLRGYFIHNKYIPYHIFEKINIIPTDTSLLLKNYDNYYFIHIRLGDYLKNSLYRINLTAYYNYCINEIIKKDNSAKFIICTNQYDKYLHLYINNFPKNVKYHIQKSTDDELDTLYIMSSCKGGICSNSTLSFMGNVFQKNKDNKTKDNFYMPYPFVSFINGFNSSNMPLDMYPEWCTIYDTINSNVINNN